MADNFLTVMDREKPEILKLLPDYVSADRWWALAYEVSRSRDLQRIAQNNPMSLIAAIKKIADWGLDLDGEECLIIPYGDEAQAQAMYKGLIRRAIEAEVCVHVYADLIREGDHIDEISGSRRELTVKHQRFSNKKIIGAYAVAYLANGLTDYEIFEQGDIDAVKKAALRLAQRRDKSAGESPAWRFFEGQMIKKSVLRRLLQRMRGRRSSEAGRRYAELVTKEPTFDVEVEATDNIDLPGEENKDGDNDNRAGSAGVGPSVAIVKNAPPSERTGEGHGPVRQRPPSDGQGSGQDNNGAEDRFLSPDEQGEIFDLGDTCGLTGPALSDLMKKRVGVIDPAQVKASQLGLLKTAIQAAKR